MSYFWQTRPEKEREDGRGRGDFGHDALTTHVRGRRGGGGGISLVRWTARIRVERSV